LWMISSALYRFCAISNLPSTAVQL